MCATVCPSQALAYITPEDAARRPSKPTNVFQFGSQTITTKVAMMVPAQVSSVTLDVADFIWEGKEGA